MQKSITENSLQTQELAENFAKEILQRKSGQHAVILCLRGELGAGKTTFLQGFARGLGIKENILSPTFVIMKKFPIESSHFASFYHFDVYRLHNDGEILDLGFKNIIAEAKNIVAIEWPENIESLLPKNIIAISFSSANPNQRIITINENGV